MTDMEVAVGVEVVEPALSIKLDVQISNDLKEQFRAEISEMVKGIVHGVLSGLNEKIQSIVRENTALKKKKT